MQEISIYTQAQPSQVKEYQEQRVLTFKDIDTLHQRPDGTDGRNFRENKERFIMGEDYFNLSYKEVRATNFVERPNSQGLILLTFTGYLMLAKSLSDDLGQHRIMPPNTRQKGKSKIINDEISVYLRI